MLSHCSKGFKVWNIIAAPASCRNCLGRSLAIRLPLPAAAIIAVFIKKRNSTTRANATPQQLEVLALLAQIRDGAAKSLALASGLRNWLAVGNTDWTTCA